MNQDDRLCVSNIAWSVADEGKAHELLARLKVRKIELAPTRRWSVLDAVPEASVREYAGELAGHGLTPVGFQALLFGKSEWNLFNESDREPMARYLMTVIRLAQSLKATKLVFGSPKNRRRGALSCERAWEVAVDFFRPLAGCAAISGVEICIEANPQVYGCDFINNTDEAARLVRAVGSPGLRLHGDTGGMIINGEDADRLLTEHGELLAHFHVSEPFLGPFTEFADAHRRIAAALKRGNYRKALSIEMKMQPDGLAAVERAVKFVRDCYRC